MFDRRTPRGVLAGTALLLCLGAPLLAVAQQSTGLIFTDPAAYQSIPLATPPPAGDLPARADFSSLFPRPGEQGEQGSCVGWAVAYALKSYQERQERGWSFTGPDRVFSPAYVYNQIKRGDCEGGSQFTDALDLLTREGVAPLSAFGYDPNDCRRLPDAATRQAAREFAVASWRRVNVQDITEIKSQIAAGFPVLFGMIVDAKFMDLTGDVVYSSPTDDTRGGHAMVVTGYDDARKAFHVINSWGTSWGDGGFGWIDYNTFRQTVREAYVVQDIVRNTPPDVVEPPPQKPDLPVWSTKPAAKVDVPLIHHNNWRNGFWWMDLTVPGLLSGYQGRSAIVVIRFSFQDGTPLYAHPSEQQYVDVDRKVVTGQWFTVPSPSYDLRELSLTIPYYAFNLKNSGGATTYNLVLWADVYVDNMLVTQSPYSVPFTVRW